MPLPPAPTQRATLLSQASVSSAQRTPNGSIKQGKTSMPLHEPHPNPPPVNKVAKAVQVETKVADKNTLVAASPASDAASAVASTVRKSAHKASSRNLKSKKSGPTKLFVLDTNVLMHDPMCLFRFEEHDIYLPMIVLEELDGHKKGMTEVARNARQASRSLDALAATRKAPVLKAV